MIKPRLVHVFTPEEYATFTKNYPSTYTYARYSTSSVTVITYPNKEVWIAQQADPLTTILHAARAEWREINHITTTTEFL